MTPKIIWISIGIALASIVALIFIYPHQMVSPGNLRPAHAELQDNCFACHAPLRGASPDRCIACHKVADIGLRTTKGTPVSRRTGRPPFHQYLTSQNCMACHSDHAMPRLARKRVRTFDHAMLQPDARQRCATCHSPPVDDLHRGGDKSCAQCHGTQAWKPATFEHSRYFSLSSPHNASCATCHLGGNLRVYTCFGCHEHQKSQIEARHSREGIRDTQNCARCHRGADGEHGQGGEGDRSSGGDRERDD
jgi:hypothetical protein